MSSTPLPANVHVSNHPCLQAKLSQLRSASTTSRETKALVNEIALIIGCEALASSVKSSDGGTDTTPLGYTYTTQTLSPSSISLVPILRSGLGMTEALQTLLPSPVPIHHLGLYREPTSLQPVEYYNNLPYHTSGPSSKNTSATPLAILLDPLIATGGTAAAAIQTLKEWGVERVLMLSVLGSEEGLRRAAEEWSEGVEVWVGGVDEGGVNEKGMIKPGLGDVGDRLFMAVGK
ncbi:hypothetical protein FQN54_003222 [Arachnomyces sp. PD_36]|nr:hypothetical protein FQN54_003222 [Arachnomyces sp. PD_36]